MAEAIHCPSCTTRYRLRPERLKPIIRRAKCFTCGGEFPVGDVVQRLLAPPPQAATAAFAPAAVAAMQEEHLEPALPPDAAFAPLPDPAPAPLSASSLSADDLNGADVEILEKTLVAMPPSLPEAKVEPPSPYPAEITETTLSGYTSARDAINKLFGDAPTSAAGLKPRQDSNPMDMEATLSALESTLGGAPVPPPDAATGTRDGSSTAAGLTEEDLEEPSKSTLRLSQADLLAALASAPPAPTPSASEPTVALRASDLVSAREDQLGVGATVPVHRSFTPLPEIPDPSSEQLRLKIGEEIYGGLTMPQLIGWVEEGRILENHLVARQHSENWLEAQKVPGLRPVFERLRRERFSAAPAPEAPTPGEIAPKKSLFGGLFGKN